jgi:pimeloyl-ACP methyl ester carboxylesterase
MTDIVLIHGAFHGGWCWRAVARRLRAAGHAVFAPTLTGLGERAHLIGPAVDLDTHIADIVNVIEAEELSDVVLVGHSYGGMPVTGAADRLADRLSALVYLDAVTPADGDTGLGVRSAEPGAVPLEEPADGYSVPAPKAAVFGLTGDLGAWADRRLTPHPMATMTQPIRLRGDWRRIARKVYIRLARYPAPHFDRSYEAARDDPDWTAIHRDDIHDVMVTDPGWVVGVLKDTVLG